MANVLCWDTDAHTFRVYSDGVLVLETPLATLTEAPALLVGKDPATALPAYCPAPVPTQIVTATAITVDPAPVTPATVSCTQLRCGAAKALVLKLDDDYGKFQGWINGALEAILLAFVGTVGLTVSTIVDFLTAGFGLVLTPVELAMVAAVSAFLGKIVLANLANGLPDISNLNLARLQQFAFCAITCSGDQVLLDKTQMQAFQSAVAGSPNDWYFGLEQDFIGAILLWGANQDLSDWAATASNGAANPSTDCDAYVCP